MKKWVFILNTGLLMRSFYFEFWAPAMRKMGTIYFVDFFKLNKILAV